MKPERWRRADDIFQAVLEIDPEERSAFLDSSCSGDDALRKDVESLLAYDSDEPSLIDTPAMEMVARVLSIDGQELSAGQYFGQYKILGLLGMGGMGEVYLAYDASLGRRIALKLLPSEFSVDDERTRRFQQEARAASALNHPNIITIYQIGRIENRQFIATEFIEGRTLRQVFSEARMDLAEAVDISTQIAGALAAAHQAGIVHRDIKPENIMIRPDGYVKVLDFGLAKLTEREVTSVDTTEQTLEQLDTRPGIVLGTIRYMSPEQARGQRVDGRSDIFSLGVLLYEMIAGHPPFEGATTSDLIAAILTTEPKPVSLPSDRATGEAQRIISNALKKAREDRYESADEFHSDLKALLQNLQLESKIQRALDAEGKSGPSTEKVINGHMEGVGTELTVGRGRTWQGGARSFARRILHFSRSRLGTTAIAVIVLAGAIGLGYGVYRHSGWWASPHFQTIRMSSLTTSGKAFGATISPDGRYVAFLDNIDGRQGLWIRQLATSSNILVSADVQPESPLTFSPDGDYIFYAARMPGDTKAAAFKVPALGGIPVKVTAHVSSAVAVSPDGRRIAFLRKDSRQDTLMIANVDGSEERMVTAEQSPNALMSVAWFAEGKRLAFARNGRDDSDYFGEVLEVDDDGRNQRALTDRRSWGYVAEIAWLPDGSALLMTAAERTRVNQLIWQISYPSGEVRPVTSDLTEYNGLSVTQDSMTLVSIQRIAVYNLYRYASAEGKTLQVTSGASRADGWSGISWTPGGKAIYSSIASGHPDIWSMQPDGSDQRQLTVGLASDNRGLCVSPDGRHIVFVSRKGGLSNVWRTDIDGGNPTQLTRVQAAFNPFFSPDGEWVFYLNGAQRVAKVPSDGGDPVQLSSPLSEMVPRGLSPDGKLVAYQPSSILAATRQLALASTEDGRFIRHLNLPRQIHWRPDGQELAYVDGRGGVQNMWSQPIDGGAPRQLTDFREAGYRIHAFAWSPDGRYLMFSRGIESKNAVLVRSVE